MFAADPDALPAAVPAAYAATWRPPDRAGFVAVRDGRIRVASWTGPATPRATVLVLTGRGEFIEKYATEIVGELLVRDFAVVATDWRGQGLSTRPLPDRQTGHIDDFETYMNDLDAVRRAALPTGGPVLALCHSMGGHVLLRSLAERGSTWLTGGLLAAPMTALKREAILRTILLLMPPVAAVDQRYLYGTGPFRVIGREFAINRVTHDERRYRFTDVWYGAEPRLLLGGPSIGWVRQAIRSVDKQNRPGLLETIVPPLTLLSAGQDRLVDSASHAPVAARLSAGELERFDDARHEIMMETDAIRARFWHAWDRLANRALA
ncbi:MAG: alpha/beta hydrolase [Alphaproteobacteria bacterium]|nr:alpha/beta hydrolase [Alphaproteobacteria bacterium]